MKIIEKAFISISNVGSAKLFAKVNVTCNERRHLFQEYFETGESATYYVNQDCFVIKKQTKFGGKVIKALLLPYSMLKIGYKEAWEDLMTVCTLDLVYYYTIVKNTPEFDKIKSLLEPQFSKIFQDENKEDKKKNVRFFDWA